MFNRKPNWRAGIVGLASLALLATFPLATVTASAETVEPTPAGTVEQVATAESPEVDLKELSAKADSPEGVSVERAASGYNAFRMAGQDRSADPEITGRKPLPSGTLWSLGEHGELVKTVWEKNKYVPKESRDIPYGSVQCGSPYNGRNRDSQFDGLAVSNDGNTMYALSGFLGLPSNDGRSAGTSIYRYYNGGWSTYSLSWVSDRNWKISEKPLSWGPCNDGWKSANYTSENRNDRYNQKSYKHTFAHSMTQFTSGAMVNVDGKEYYIFGGYNTTKNHSQPQTIKFFAFDPSAKTVDYLGFVPTASGKDHSFTNSDFTVDEDGHLYFSQSSKSGESAATVKIRRINSGTLKSLIRNRGNFRFSGNGSDGWDDRFETKPGYLNSHSGSRDWAITVDPNFSFSTVVRASDLNDSNHSYTHVDVFAGFDFDPSGNVALSFNGSKGSTGPSSGASYNPEGANGGSSGSEVVVLYDKQGKKVKNYKPFYYPVAGNSASGVIHQKTGGYGNIFNHDIVGSPFSVQPRSFKLSKKVVGRRPYDQFVVDLNPTSVSDAAYQINSGSSDNQKTKTSFTSANGTQAIGKKVEGKIVPTKIGLPSEEFTARIGERTYEGSQRVATQGRYDTTLECSDGVTADPYVDGAGQNRYFDITVSSTAGDDLQCTIINKAKVPSAKVTVYKNFKSRDDQHYRYSVGFSNGSSEHSSVTGWQTLNDDVKMPAATDIDVPVGANIKVFEKDTQRAIDLGGSLNKYTVNIACYNGVGRDEHNRIGSVAGTELNLTVPSPKLASKKISCYVDNALTPKDKTVTLYKKFDRRYKNSDNFKVFAEVPLAYPLNRLEGQTTNRIYPNASATTPLASKVFKKDATITVGEIGVDGASLDNYDTDVKCTEGGFNGRALPVAATQGRSKQFNLSSTTSSTVDCYVINKARKKVTIHKSFNRRFVDSDNFTVTATNMNKQDQSVSGTTTGTGTENQGQNIPLGTQTAFSHDAYLKVTETASGQTDLSHYTTSIKCTVDGPNGASIPAGQGSGSRTSYFDLSNVTSPVVDCYVTNTVPEPERTITVKKIFKNDTTTEGFSISGYFGTYSNAFNKPDTSGHNVNEAFDVTAAPKKISKGQDVLAVFNEGARPDRHIESYDISVVCKGEGADSDLDNITDDKTVKITGTTNGNSWEGRGTIPAKLTGSITCTLINEKPANTKVVLFKQLKTFNDNDQFNVGLEPQNLNNAEYGITQVAVPGQLTAETSNDGYKKYKIGTIAKRPKGQNFQFNITETATSGELANYTPKVTCKAVSPDSSEADIQGLVNLPLTTTVTIPQTQKGEVHCYLRNEPKPKVTVTLYKQLKRFKESDQFTVGLYDPETKQAFHEISTQSATHTKVAVDSRTADYDEYTVGSHVFAQSEDGVKFRVGETATNGAKITNYSPSLVCKSFDDATGEWKVFDPKPNGKPAEGNTTMANGTIPAGKTGEVHCYLRNAPEVNVVLYKQLKRYAPTDQFRISMIPDFKRMGMTEPAQATPYTINRKETDVLQGSPDSDGYTQYEIGSITVSPGNNPTAGLLLKIKESAKSGDLANYTPKVTCKAVKGGQETNIQGAVDVQINQGAFPVTIPAAQYGEVHCYLRNEPKPKGSITIVKTSGTAKLSGSGWKIEKKQGTSWVDYGVIGDDDANQSNLDRKKGTGKYIKDAIKASTGENKGKIKISDLPVGTYRVTEILAPAGFQITEAAAAGFEITVSADSLNPSQTVVNTPAEVPELPFTGGWGTLPYMILGFVLTGGAVVAFVIAKPKNTKPSHK